MRCTINVPTHYNNGEPIPLSICGTWSRTMIAAFGGMTAYEAIGVWVNDKGETVGEGMVVYEGYVVEHWDGNAKIQAKRAIEDLAATIKVQAEQDAVLITIEGKAYLV